MSNLNTPSRIEMIQPDDWHLHIRDGDVMKDVLADTARQFARAIIMPNLKPPVTTVDLAKAYQSRINANLKTLGITSFTPLMTLYLTDNTSADEVRKAKTEGIVAFKLYPAGATTNSDAGVSDIKRCYQALEAMQAVGMPLLVHGEVTTADIDYLAGNTASLKASGVDQIAAADGSGQIAFTVSQLSLLLNAGANGLVIDPNNIGVLTVNNSTDLAYLLGNAQAIDQFKVTSVNLANAVQNLTLAQAEALDVAGLSVSNAVVNLSAADLAGLASALASAFSSVLASVLASDFSAAFASAFSSPLASPCSPAD